MLTFAEAQSRNSLQAQEARRIRLDQLEGSRMRLGKTKKDRASGAHERNRNNKLERDRWAKDGGKFPSHTCNGKRNRIHK